MSKSPSLRRIQADIRELQLDPSDQYSAAPLENDMFEWHFTIRGAVGTDFDGGIYHGRILLPAEYPYKPPHIVFLTPSGRFETNTKVCLSFSAYHPELWQPAWGIRLILEALISFLPTPGDGAIGALDYKPEERRRLAKLSQTWCCPTCGPIAKLIPTVDPEKKKSAKTGAGSSFSKQIAELKLLQERTEGGKRTNKTEEEVANDDESKTTTKTVPPGVASSSEGRTEERKASTINGDENDKKAAVTSPIEKSENDIQNSTTNETANKAVDTETKQPTQLQQASESDAEEVQESISLQTDADEAATIEEAPDAATDNFSKLYDPLVNVSILLMICICILLWKKGMDLYQELQQLKATPFVENGLAAGQPAAASSVPAASSDEL
eukprot:jgi/Psemu1/66422/estExt_Genemark1.C_2070029